MSSNPGYTATAKSLHWCRAHQCITSRQHREFPLLLYPYAGLHPKHAAFLARLYNSKSAADKPSDYLSTNQRHMSFDKPAHPYLAAVQALIAFCHYRVSANALTLTGREFRPARPRASPSK